MPHTVCPAVLQAQVPAVHVAVVGHAKPHEPQLVRFVCRSTHVVPHDVVPPGHTHAPAVHTAVAAHA